jgi:glycerophosphoryl diester phosphodiesterase
MHKPARQSKINFLSKLIELVGVKIRKFGVLVFLTLLFSSYALSQSGLGLTEYEDRGVVQDEVRINSDSPLTVYRNAKVASPPITDDVNQNWETVPMKRNFGGTIPTWGSPRDAYIDVSSLSEGNYVAFMWGCNVANRQCGWQKPILFTKEGCDPDEETEITVRNPALDNAQNVESLGQDNKINPIQNTRFELNGGGCSNSGQYEWTITDEDVSSDSNVDDASDLAGVPEYSNIDDEDLGNIHEGRDVTHQFISGGQKNIEITTPEGETIQRTIHVKKALPDELYFSPHRGGMWEAPENTITAFENSRKHGMDSVEFDVRKAEDGLVVFHDKKVNDLTEGEGRLDSFTKSELKDLSFMRELDTSVTYPDRFNGRNDIGIREEEIEGAEIPTLAETLDYYQGTDVVMRMELKGKVKKNKNGIGMDVYEMVEERDMVDQTIFISFSGTCRIGANPLNGAGTRRCDWNTLEQIEQENSDATTGILWQKRKDPRRDGHNIAELPPEHALSQAEQHNIDIIIPRVGGINGLGGSFTMNLDEFMRRTDDRNLDVAFMGLSNDEGVRYGAEWLSTNKPSKLAFYARGNKSWIEENYDTADYSEDTEESPLPDRMNDGGGGSDESAESEDPSQQSCSELSGSQCRERSECTYDSQRRKAGLSPCYNG